MSDETKAALNELEGALDALLAGESPGKPGDPTMRRILRKVNSLIPDIQENNRYHRILRAIDALDIQVVELDSEGTVLYANAAGKSLLCGMEKLCMGDATDGANKIITHIIEHSSGDEGFPVVDEIHEQDGSTWYKVISDTSVTSDGRRLYLHVADDVTEWRHNEKQLEYSASVDALTGALNRRAGYELLRIINNRPSAQTHCLALVDLDGLKKVNDTCGHLEGDEFIRTVADVLTSSSRASETLVRFGGDEFFIVFQDCLPALAEKAMQRMQHNLKELNRLNGKPYEMSFSYGIEPFGKGMKPVSVEALLEKADKKMYADKAAKYAKAEAAAQG